MFKANMLKAEDFILLCATIVSGAFCPAAFAQDAVAQDIFRFSMHWHAEEVIPENEDLDLDSSETIDEVDLLLTLERAKYPEPTETPTFSPSPTPTLAPVNTPFYIVDGDWASAATFSNGDYLLAYGDDNRLRFKEFFEDGEEKTDEESRLEEGSGRPYAFVDSDRQVWIVYEYYEDRIRLYHEQTPLNAYLVSELANQRKPAIAVDSFGKAAIVWEARNYDKVLLRYAHYDSGEDLVLFSEGGHFLSDESEEQKDPDIAVNDDDYFLATWTKHDHSIKANFFSYRNPPEDDEDIRLSDGPNDPGRPRVAALGDDYFLVVWDDSRSGKDEIFGRLIDGQGDLIEDTDFRIDDSPAGARRAAVAAHPFEDLFLVAWEDRRDGDRAIYATTCFPQTGQIAGPSRRLTEPTDHDVERISLVFSKEEDRQGDFVVAWKQGGDLRAILYRLETDGEGSFSIK